jgi:hypothetical protein
MLQSASSQARRTGDRVVSLCKYKVVDRAKRNPRHPLLSCTVEREIKSPKQNILYYLTMKHTLPLHFMWVCYGEETADKKDDIALMFLI